MQQLWLVTVPNNKGSPDQTYNALRDKVENTGVCRIHRFEMPSLVVGTLDSLMALSDELTKINSQVENVVRKVERQYHDISGPTAELLRINSTKVEVFLRKFQWDNARYQFSSRPLSEIVAQIQSMAAKVDEELKKLSAMYNEKNLNLSSLQRKKTVNLSTSDFEDFLKPTAVAKLELLNTETLLTVMVVMPAAIENEFLKTYDTLGSDIAGYGGPDWTNSLPGRNDGNFGSAVSRATKKGSPVVPGSHVKVCAEGESIMYSIVVLRGQYEAGKFEGDTFVPGNSVDYIEPLKHAFREKRFVLREFSYDASKSGGLDGLITTATTEVQQVHQTIVRWCQAHYGEAYSGWIHLKVIRGFIESVLRYGLPLDFLPVFIEPNMKKEKQLKGTLIDTISRMRPELAKQKMELAEAEEEDDTENLPFVCQKFNVIGAGGEEKN